MPSVDFIRDQQRAAEEAAARARENARQDALDALMADPRLLARAEAANAEIATLEQAAARATESFDALDRQMQKATLANDEKELARLEGLFGARKRLRDHAIDSLDDACARHELLRSAARIFREREQLEREYPSLEGNGRNVEEAVACLSANIAVFRESLVDAVHALAEAIRERNASASSFDTRAESAGYGKRTGQIATEHVLEGIVKALRDKDWMHSGRPLDFALRNNGNAHTLVFGFAEPGIRP
jgi:hypothetical protein